MREDPKLQELLSIARIFHLLGISYQLSYRGSYNTGRDMLNIVVKFPDIISPSDEIISKKRIIIESKDLKAAALFCEFSSLVIDSNEVSDDLKIDLYKMIFNINYELKQSKKSEKYIDGLFYLLLNRKNVDYYKIINYAQRIFGKKDEEIIKFICDNIKLQEIKLHFLFESLYQVPDTVNLKKYVRKYFTELYESEKKNSSLIDIVMMCEAAYCYLRLGEIPKLVENIQSYPDINKNHRNFDLLAKKICSFYDEAIHYLAGMNRDEEAKSLYNKYSDLVEKSEDDNLINRFNTVRFRLYCRFNNIEKAIEEGKGLLQEDPSQDIYFSNISSINLFKNFLPINYPQNASIEIKILLSYLKVTNAVEKGEGTEELLSEIFGFAKKNSNYISYKILAAAYNLCGYKIVTDIFNKTADSYVEDEFITLPFR